MNAHNNGAAFKQAAGSEQIAEDTYTLAELESLAKRKLVKILASIEDLQNQGIERSEYARYHNKRDHATTYYALPHETHDGGRSIQRAIPLPSGEWGISEHLIKAAKNRAEEMDKVIIAEVQPLFGEIHPLTPPSLNGLQSFRIAVSSFVHHREKTDRIDRLYDKAELMLGVIRAFKGLQEGHPANEFGFATPKIDYPLTLDRSPKHTLEWVGLLERVLWDIKPSAPNIRVVPDVREPDGAA